MAGGSPLHLVTNWGQQSASVAHQGEQHWQDRQACGNLYHLVHQVHVQPQAYRGAVEEEVVDVDPDKEPRANQRTTHGTLEGKLEARGQEEEEQHQARLG